jgi:hypothetical protein
MAEQTEQVEQKKIVRGQTVLSFTKPTPTWATNIFRVVFIITGIAVFIIGADPVFDADLKIRIGIYLKGFDMLVWAVTRAIGIDITRDYHIPAQ